MKSPEEIRADNATLDRLLVKAKWAKNHIVDLENACERFDNSRPYVVRSESNPNTLERSYYLVSVADIPREIPGHVGDILFNLRATLDHLAHHLVCIGTGDPGPHTSVYFPISESPKAFESDLVRKVKGAGQEAIKAIRMLHPYKGGNNTLWQLHELHRLDKHRLHLSVGTAYMGHNLTPSEREEVRKVFPALVSSGSPGVMTSVKNIRILKAGDILRTIPEADVEENMKFQIDISFDEPGITQPEPIVTALNIMAFTVAAIVIDFNTLGLL